MSKFKVGDRVKIRDNNALKSHYDYIRALAEYCGKTATIKRYLSEGKNHEGKYLLEEFPWSWYDNMLDPVVTQKILITTDGTTTIARLYDGKRVIRTAEAKCAPSDTFDFTAGANIAYDRLMRPKVKTEPKPAEPIKLYCVRDDRGYCRLEKGKVYEAKDNRVYDDAKRSTAYSQDWLKKYFAPLIQRPAKVGEWVYIVNVHSKFGNVHPYFPIKVGETHKVTQTDPGARPTMIGGGAAFTLLYLDEYLVLDGYKGETK